MTTILRSALVLVWVASATLLSGGGVWGPLGMAEWQAGRDAAPARAAAYWTADDTRAAMAEHSALAGCIVEIETGHTLDPYSLGAQGEVGVAQLHPRGMLPVFYARGWTDPWSPYQAMGFLEDALDRGEGHYWTAYWWCG